MDLFQNFQRECPAPAALCEKYASALPPELLKVWRDYGFGTLLDGCLKIINDTAVVITEKGASVEEMPP